MWGNRTRLKCFFYDTFKDIMMVNDATGGRLLHQALQHSMQKAYAR
jgi:hypothetical protein